MIDFIMYGVLVAIVAVIIFDVGIDVGKKRAVHNFVTAAQKLPLSDEIRQAIDEALKTP